MPHPTEKTILFVDDDVAFHHLFRSWFEDQPYRIVTHASGEAALAWLKDNPTDLVITDQHMQGINGVAFLEQAKSFSPHSNFILVSGYLDAPTTLQMLDAGFHQIFPKPLNPKALLSCMEHLLAHPYPSDQPLRPLHN